MIFHEHQLDRSSQVCSRAAACVRAAPQSDVQQLQQVNLWTRRSITARHHRVVSWLRYSGQVCFKGCQPTLPPSPPPPPPPPTSSLSSSLPRCDTPVGVRLVNGSI